MLRGAALLALFEKWPAGQLKDQVVPLTKGELCPQSLLQQGSDFLEALFPSHRRCSLTLVIG